MGFRFITVLAAALAVPTAASWAQTPTPDTVLVNGKIVTVDDTFSIAQAVAIQGERIVAVGDTKRVRRMAGPNTKVIDLGGKTVVPGMIDSHAHFIRAAAFWDLEARLDAVPTRRQALDILTAKARNVKPGEWLITIGGWDEEQFTDSKKGFTREELDRISPNNPAFLQVNYSHAYVNSAGLTAANIPLDRAGPDEVTGPVLSAPGAAGAGIKVERDKDGKATGRIDGIAALFRVRGKIFGPLPPARAEASVLKMANDFVGSGVTAMFDGGGGGTTDASYVPVRKLADEGRLPLRIRHGLWITPQKTEDVDKAIEKIKATQPFRGNSNLELISLGELVHFRLVDNLVDAIPNNPEFLNDFRRTIEVAAERGWPLQLHAHQASSISLFLTEMEKVNQTRPLKPLRWQIVHADRISAAEIERLRKLGVALSVSGSMLLGAADNRHALGDHGLDMPPLHLIRDSGLKWALSTDATAVNVYNPFVTLGWAVTGRGLNGSVISRQTVSRQQALAAYTRNSAYFIFEENNLGSIEPGKMADLVVLDRDYLTVPAEQIRNIKPVQVMVGGKTVFPTAR